MGNTRWQWLALPTVEHGILGLNPTGGGIQLMAHDCTVLHCTEPFIITLPLSQCNLNNVLRVIKHQGPFVQSIVSLASSLRIISLTVLADSIHNILIFFAEKMWVAFAHFFSKKFQHICVSLDVNFNESLTNDVVSFEQLGPNHHQTPVSQNGSW